MWSKISGSLRPREENDAFHVEDIISSLRTQLALQRELCAQFEIDLGARDELVVALSTRLEAVEKENSRRRRTVRSWKKRASDLEKLCRRLELEEQDPSVLNVQQPEIDVTEQGEESDVTEEESGEHEKSVIEAERDALTQAVERAGAEIAGLREQLDATETAKVAAINELHGQISQLEQERNDLHAERDNFSSEISRLRVHIQQLQKDSATKEVMIVQLNRQLEQDKEDIDGLNIALESKQQELELVKRKHGARSNVGPNPRRTNVSEKENASTMAPMKHRRRTLMVPA